MPSKDSGYSYLLPDMNFADSKKKKFLNNSE